MYHFRETLHTGCDVNLTDALFNVDWISYIRKKEFLAFTRESVRIIFGACSMNFTWQKSFPAFAASSHKAFRSANLEHP